jgi:hypothetical protein
LPKSLSNRINREIYGNRMKYDGVSWSFAACALQCHVGPVCLTKTPQVFHRSMSFGSSIAGKSLSYSWEV